jgi:hypothetical protein
MSELTCNADGSVASTRSCVAEGLVCAPEIGCSVCVPGRGSCDGNTTQICNADGTAYTPGESCDASGLTCDPSTGTCADLCAAAAASSSYIGCEYWPTPVMNPVAEEFEFAVVVANPQVVPALVTVERAGAMLSSVTVVPGGIEAIRLPWVDALKNPFMPRPGGEPDEVVVMSALVRDGAYRLSSNVPVTAYQFNPLEYEIARDCVDEIGGPPTDGRCNSYSNDASLLIPSHVLSGNYIAMSLPAQLRRIRLRDDRDGTLVTDPDTGEIFEVYSHSPGYVAVVAVDDGDVEIRPTANVQASTDGSVARIAAGRTASFALRRGDVLQLVTDEPPERCDSSPIPEEITPQDCMGIPCSTIDMYCEVSADYDLTGTEVEATGRVAVISGHYCAFVPYYRWACDHLEESMFPLEAWGQDIVIAYTFPLRDEPNVIRVVSGADGNTVSFDPVSVHGPATLDRGESVEFEASSGFRVTGTEAVMVGQLLVGQDYAGRATAGSMGRGDPALSLGIPTEQFRDNYTFLAPTTFDQSIVSITAAPGQEVLLDGAPITGLAPIGSTGLASAQIEVTGGQHSIASGAPFGIVVYGFGAYTSYMVPGGLDLEVINAPF